MTWYTLDENEQPVRMGDIPTRGFRALEVWPPLKTKVDDYEVSTVFLGLDHQYGFGEQGDPVLWETMIFGSGPVPWASGDDHEYQERYTSADAARMGHDQTVQRLRDKIADMTPRTDPATPEEMTTMPDRIVEIEARACAATPGPWVWRGNVDIHNIYLRSVGERGSPNVLTFGRWGMQSAKPVFNSPDNRGLLQWATETRVQFEVSPDATHRTDPRVYRGDIIGIRHPDAEFIAHAREDINYLLARIRELEAPDAE